MIPCSYGSDHADFIGNSIPVPRLFFDKVRVLASRNLMIQFAQYYVPPSSITPLVSRGCRATALHPMNFWMKQYLALSYQLHGFWVVVNREHRILLLTIPFCLVSSLIDGNLLKPLDECVVINVNTLAPSKRRLTSW